MKGGEMIRKTATAFRRLQIEATQIKTGNHKLARTLLNPKTRESILDEYGIEGEEREAILNTLSPIKRDRSYEELVAIFFDEVRRKLGTTD